MTGIMPKIAALQRHATVHASAGRRVSVIVPVYRGLQETQRCLLSVLQAATLTPWRLIVIDDCSPEPELSAWLRQLADRHPERLCLIRHDSNQGFVRSVNDGLALAAADDVVLLNSDTEVASGWLDRLARACLSAEDVGTVTPWSNHATIFSYPAYPAGGEMPAGFDTATLDALCAQWLAGQSVEVPTAHGFCMFIRAECLAATGGFDAAAFGLGYGEENDFCLRASRLGWRHLHALDVYVYHRGSVSFGLEREQRVQHALAVIRQRYPDYEAEVQRYLQADPTARARRLLDLACYLQPDKARVLFVSHDGVGGTERHQIELSQALADQARFLRLQPCPGGAAWSVMGVQRQPWHYRLPADHDLLVADLRRLGVRLVHYHHWLGLPDSILDLAARLGVPYDVTLHDYYSYCPQVHLSGEAGLYCGEHGDEQCRACLRRHPGPDGTRDIHAWRQRHARFLAGARHVIAPSHDTARRVKRHFALDICVVPHDVVATGTPPSWPTPRPSPIDPGRKLRVLALGALGPIKGADLLEATAILALRREAAVEFHLLGYAYRSLRTYPEAALSCHGAYEDAMLPKLLQELQPDVVWLPSRVPETYSYTLSAALAAGLPVAAIDLGALGERLHGRAWSWLLPLEADAEAWLALFEQIRQRLLCAPFGETPVAHSHTRLGDVEQTRPTLDYRRDYLPPATPAPFPPDEVLRRLWDRHQRHRPLQQSPTRRWRAIALRWLIQLRCSPMLRPLARRIPPPLQRNVKRWLLR